MRTDDIRVDIIRDIKKREALIDIILQASEEAFSDSAFRAELAHYVKMPNTSSSFGMPTSTMGIPLPLAPFASFMVRKVNVARMNKTQDRKIFLSAPITVLISAKKDEPMNWVRVGEIFEHIALEATRREISTHVSEAAIQIGDYYKKIQGVIGFGGHRPQMFFRMGYPEKLAPPQPAGVDHEIDICARHQETLS